ncbi:hypothetical protein ABTK97_20035, partial [Acinetobacter baumannii]
RIAGACHARWHDERAKDKTACKPDDKREYDENKHLALHHDHSPYLNRSSIDPVPGADIVGGGTPPAAMIG